VGGREAWNGQQVRAGVARDEYYSFTRNIIYTVRFIGPIEPDNLR